VLHSLNSKLRVGEKEGDDVGGDDVGGDEVGNTNSLLTALKVELAFVSPSISMSTLASTIAVLVL